MFNDPTEMSLVDGQLLDGHFEGGQILKGYGQSGQIGIFTAYVEAIIAALYTFAGVQDIGPVLDTMLLKNISLYKIQLTFWGT